MSWGCVYLITNTPLWCQLSHKCKCVPQHITSLSLPNLGNLNPTYFQKTRIFGQYLKSNKGIMHFLHIIEPCQQEPSFLRPWMPRNLFHWQKRHPRQIGFNFLASMTTMAIKTSKENKHGKLGSHGNSSR